MMTRSGVLVLPRNDGIPTLGDIAYGLSGLPRFVAQLDKPWTVGQHSLACENLAWSQIEGARVMFFALMHDAHESVTGDTPKTWKTTGLKLFQQELDERLWRSLGVRPPTPQEAAIVKKFDDRIVLAEARQLAPMGTYEAICDDLGMKADRDAVNVVKGIVGRQLTPGQVELEFFQNASAWLTDLKVHS